MARHIAYSWVADGRKLLLDTYLEAQPASLAAPRTLRRLGMTAPTNHRRRVGTTLLLGAALMVPTAGTAIAQPARDSHPAAAADASDPAWAASPRSQENSTSAPTATALGTDVAATDQQAPTVAPGVANALATEKYYALFGAGGPQPKITGTPITPDDGTDPLLLIGLSLTGVLVAGGSVATVRRHRHRVTRVLA